MIDPVELLRGAVVSDRMNLAKSLEVLADLSNSGEWNMDTKKYEFIFRKSCGLMCANIGRVDLYVVSDFNLFWVEKIIRFGTIVVSIDGVSERRIATRIRILCSWRFNLVFHTETAFLVAYVSAKKFSPGSSTTSRNVVNAATFWIQRRANHVRIHSGANRCPRGVTGRITRKIVRVVFCVCRAVIQIQRWHKMKRTKQLRLQG